MNQKKKSQLPTTSQMVDGNANHAPTTTSKEESNAIDARRIKITMTLMESLSICFKVKLKRQLLKQPNNLLESKDYS